MWSRDKMKHFISGSTRPIIWIKLGKVVWTVLQDPGTTKRGWKETYNQTWCDQIMLSTPQRFNALGSYYMFWVYWKQNLKMRFKNLSSAIVENASSLCRLSYFFGRLSKLILFTAILDALLGNPVMKFSVKVVNG